MGNCPAFFGETAIDGTSEGVAPNPLPISWWSESGHWCGSARLYRRV